MASTSEVVDNYNLLNIDNTVPDLTSLKELKDTLPDISIFKKKYGLIADLLSVKVDYELISAAFEFYDPSVGGFVFPSVVLMPTIEEYSQMLNIPRNINKSAIIENIWLPNTKKSLSFILGITEEVANKLIETRNSTRGVDWLTLKDKISSNKVKTPNNDEFRMTFLAFGIYSLIIFPSAKGVADEAIIEAFGVYKMDKWDPVPAIIAETVRTLNFCKGRKIVTWLRCCTELLYIWLITHLPTKLCGRPHFTSPLFNTANPIAEAAVVSWPKRSGTTWVKILKGMDASKLDLAAFWFFPETYAYRTNVSFWIPLIGIRGVTSYAPILAFRQFKDEYVVFNLEKREPNFELKNDGQIGGKFGRAKRLWEGRQFRKTQRVDITVFPLYEVWHTIFFLKATNDQEMKDVEKPSKKRKQTNGSQSIPNSVQEIIEAQLAKALTELSLEKETKANLSTELNLTQEELKHMENSYLWVKSEKCHLDGEIQYLQGENEKIKKITKTSILARGK